MPRRKSPGHVARIKSKQNGKTYTSVLLRRSFREGPKVKHRTFGNITHLSPYLIEVIARALRGEDLVPAGLALRSERSLPHGHAAAALGTLRRLGLDRILAARRSRERDLAVALIVASALDPLPKLATARTLDPPTATSTLGSLLDLGRVDENDLYAALDWLGRRQAAVETRLARKHLSEGSIVLYDVSSSWFTGRRCPLAARGYSRDGKRGTLQVVFGVLCSEEGCPVAVEVFEGNTADPKTLSAQVEKVRERFGLRRVVLVGDRGMLTDARIREDLIGLEGLSWITALRRADIRELFRGGTVQPSLFEERDLAEVRSPEFPGERLVVCRNPRTAGDRRRRREELLAATEAGLEKLVEATRRARSPLRSERAIIERSTRILDRYRTRKFFEIETGRGHFTYRRREERIAAEADLDGFYVVRTNVPEADLDGPRAVAAYKRLGVVETAFRCFKTFSLQVRPIHHRRPDRVRAHFFLRMLAYHLEWHLRRRLAPLLFQEEDPAAARAARSSVVAPAVRSPQTRAKTAARKTEDGLPLHSYATLLRNLGALSRLTMRFPGTEHTFDQITDLTPVQSRAFDLLGVSALS